jgi:two-component system invasion response regulator UvrY
LLKDHPMLDVVVIDDQALMRTTIKEELECEADMRLVGEAQEGMTGYQLVASFAPAVVIVDVNIPGLDGVTLTRRLKAVMPKVVVIGVSAFLQDSTHQPMLDAGAHACLDKEFLVEQLTDTMRASLTKSS